VPETWAGTCDITTRRCKRVPHLHSHAEVRIYNRDQLGADTQALGGLSLPILYGSETTHSMADQVQIDQP
jgi:hypothetical protein